MSPGGSRLPRFHEIAGALHQVSCGLLGRDGRDRIVFANDRLLAWLGYRSEELVGRPVPSIAPPELHEAILAELHERGEARDSRARLTALQRKDGSTFPVLVLPQQFHDEDDRFVGGCDILVELGSVQTAKSIGYSRSGDLQGRLGRIATELHSLGAMAAAPVDGTRLDHPELEALSAREREVLGRLVAGDRVPAIAADLSLSPHTVRNHLKRIFRKLDVGSQSDLIRRVRTLSGGP